MHESWTFIADWIVATRAFERASAWIVSLSKFRFGNFDANFDASFGAWVRRKAWMNRTVSVEISKSFNIPGDKATVEPASSVFMFFAIPAWVKIEGRSWRLKGKKRAITYQNSFEKFCSTCAQAELRWFYPPVRLHRRDQSNTHPRDTHKFETYPPPFRFCPFQNHFQITYSLKPLINFSACQKRASSRTKNASNWKASTLTWHPKFKKYVTHELSEQLTKQKGAIHGAFVWTVVGFASVFTAHHLFPGFQWVLYVFSDIRRQTLALKGLLTISCKRDRLFFRLIHTQAQV